MSALLNPFSWAVWRARFRRLAGLDALYGAAIDHLSLMRVEAATANDAPMLATLERQIVVLIAAQKEVGALAKDSKAVTP